MVKIMIVEKKHYEKFRNDMEQLFKNEDEAKLTNSPEPIYITNIMPKIIEI
jgi:hypothetical protein